MTSFDILLHTLRDCVGPANVLTTGDLRAWELDWRQRERGKAQIGRAHV